MDARSSRVLVAVAFLVIAVSSVAACRSAPNLARGERTCAGLPVDVCRQQVEELEREGTTHGGVAAYRIRCTSGSCTTSGREGTVAVVFADGSGYEGGFGYAIPVGTPPEARLGLLPVAPACRGVAADTCDEMPRAGTGTP